MKTRYIATLALIAAFAFATVFASAANADEFTFSFNGNGISASGMIYATPTSTAGVDEITNITGTFSDMNAGVSGAINGLYMPISYVSNTLATPGVAFTTGGLSYDDTFYVEGNSPAICYDLIGGVPVLTYPFSGGQFDIFGVAFNIGGGDVGEIWSNGDVGFGPVVYAAGLANASGLLDDPNSNSDTIPPGRYGSFTSSQVPEPGSLFLLGMGVLGLVILGARKSKLGHVDSF